MTPELEQHGLGKSSITTKIVRIIKGRPVVQRSGEFGLILRCCGVVILTIENAVDWTRGVGYTSTCLNCGKRLETTKGKDRCVLTVHDRMAE